MIVQGTTKGRMRSGMPIYPSEIGVISFAKPAQYSTEQFCRPFRGANVAVLAYELTPARGGFIKFWAPVFTDWWPL